jgi:hypothetical protein
MSHIWPETDRTRPTLTPKKNQTERKEKLLASRISNIHTICGKYVQLARRLRIINSLLVDFVPSLTK